MSSPGVLSSPFPPLFLFPRVFEGEEAQQYQGAKLHPQTIRPLAPQPRGVRKSPPPALSRKWGSGGGGCITAAQGSRTGRGWRGWGSGRARRGWGRGCKSRPRRGSGNCFFTGRGSASGRGGGLGCCSCFCGSRQRIAGSKRRDRRGTYYCGQRGARFKLGRAAASRLALAMA